MTRRSERPIQSRRRATGKALKLFATVALACSAGLTGAAALSSVEHRLPLPNRYLALQTAANPQKNSAQKGRSNRPAQRMGDWLQSHRNVPLDQQEKALERDPDFKKLPADRQAALRDRLRKFNSLPPEQRDLALKRMNFWASLTREQRQQLRDANQKLQGLPEDRRVAIHKALRHLRQMDPQHRQQVMDSDRFKSSFSDQEQGILKQLASINPPASGTPARAPSTKP